MGLADELGMARAYLAACAVSLYQEARTRSLVDRFERFAGRSEATTLSNIDVEIVESFVRAPTLAGAQPSVSTMHWRRTAVRLVYRAARALDLTDGDPTLDLALPPRSSLRTRPLDDHEVALCRAAAQWSLEGTRRAAAWALAEATCRSSELAHLAQADLQLEDRRVWIHGGKATEARWGRLTDWGVRQLERRVHDLAGDERLVYAGATPAGAGQVAAASAISDVLVRAGLNGDADVRPGSVAAWAGRRVLCETGRIEDAARVLGVRSLDRAAAIVGFDWRTLACEEP
jgi:integrase